MHRTVLWKPFIALVALMCGTTVAAWATTHAPPAAAATPAISPYIWGTNLGLYNEQDLFLTNQATDQLAQHMHVQMIRFPDRGDLALVKAAATKIKALHMVPLVVLRYGTGNLQHNLQLVQMMNSIFGAETVYYEYGNEMDLARNGAISKEAYTASWNAVIPHLKQLSHKGFFVGPATYQANPEYVGYFVQHANPRPDGVSWHEYTCGTHDADQYCLSHIDNWTKHIQATRKAIGSTLPILITEYNWNANPNGDRRAKDTAFLLQWTQRAIMVLIQNHVFAANQYVLTNNAQLAMISDTTHALTGEGAAFQATYEQEMGHAPTATATSTPSTPTVPTTPATPTTSATPTPITTATPTGPAESAPVWCVQAGVQGKDETMNRSPWLCFKLTSPSGKRGSGASGGTLCFSLAQATMKDIPASFTGQPSHSTTVCFSLDARTHAPGATPQVSTVH